MTFINDMKDQNDSLFFRFDFYKLDNNLDNGYQIVKMKDKIREMVYRKYSELGAIVISLGLCLFFIFVSPASSTCLAYNSTQKIVNQ